MKHYVYKLEDKKTGEFYYGSRTCKCKIEEDNYMGSMKTWKPNKTELVKTIIKDDFKSRNHATIYEKEIILENYENPLNRNYSIPNTGFYAGGEPETNPNYGKRRTRKWKKEQRERMEEYYKTHPYPNEGKTFDNKWRKGISKTRIENELSKGKNNNNYGNGKTVLQCDKDGNIIKEWISGHTAAKYFKVGKENIYRCLQGKNKSSCGFTWRYKD
jgi:hypothetical protein